jgi:glutathione S-transferase
MTMTIHYHPVSTTSRPLVLFALENGLDVELKLVDLMVGEHVKPPFNVMNPNELVPVLQDGDFELTESSAILKYLADKIDSPTYPKDLKKRARVNEKMDWINTQLNRDFAYGLVYPQIFGTHQRPTDEQHKGVLSWSRERAQKWFKVLDSHVIGDKKFLTGSEITIADYYGSSFVALAEAIRLNLVQFPNVQRWYGNMKELKSWSKTYEVFYGFAGSMKDKPFVSF